MTIVRSKTARGLVGLLLVLALAAGCSSSGSDGADKKTTTTAAGAKGGTAPGDDPGIKLSDTSTTEGNPSGTTIAANKSFCEATVAFTTASGDLVSASSQTKVEPFKEAFTKIDTALANAAKDAPDELKAELATARQGFDSISPKVQQAKTIDEVRRIFTYDTNFVKFSDALERIIAFQRKNC